MADEASNWDRIVGILKNVIRPMARQHRLSELNDRMTALLAAETGDDARFTIMSELSMLMAVEGEEIASLAWATRLCKEFDHWPFAWTNMARWYRFRPPPGDTTPEDMGRALECYETALDRARAADEWVRYILFDICRLLTDLEDYPRLESTMREVLDDLENRREVDIPRIEGEWLRRVPDGALDPDLFACYRRIMAADAARSPHLGYDIYPATLDELEG